MGLLARIVGMVSGSGTSASERPSEHPPFRCLRCGAGHDREHQTCPDCGGSFVVGNSDDGTADDDARASGDAPWQ